MSDARSQRRARGSLPVDSVALRQRNASLLPTLGFLVALAGAFAAGCSGGDDECGSGDARACTCQLENQVGVQECIEGQWEDVCSCTPVLPGGGTGGGTGGGVGGGAGGAGGGSGDADAGADAG
jgi:hypothetical protein